MTGVGHRGGDDVRLRGRDDGCRAGKTQVAAIVVEALHFPFAGIWDGLALIYVWAKEQDVEALEAKLVKLFWDKKKTQK